MKKRIATLGLAMCLAMSMVVPAFAGTGTKPTPEQLEEWGVKIFEPETYTRTPEEQAAFEAEEARRTAEYQKKVNESYSKLTPQHDNFRVIGKGANPVDSRVSLKSSDVTYTYTVSIPIFSGREFNAEETEAILALDDVANELAPLVMGNTPSEKFKSAVLLVCDRFDVVEEGIDRFPRSAVYMKECKDINIGTAIWLVTDILDKHGCTADSYTAVFDYMTQDASLLGITYDGITYYACVSLVDAKYLGDSYACFTEPESLQLRDVKLSNRDNFIVPDALLEADGGILGQY